MTTEEIAKLISAAYEAGWVQCAKWADRVDLISDIGSKAFERDMQRGTEAIINSISVTDK